MSLKGQVGSYRLFIAVLFRPLSIFKGFANYMKES